MESLFVYGLGERSENLDRLSFFESEGSLFIVLLDAYESESHNVSLYFDSLCESLKEHGELYHAVSNVNPVNIKASLVVSKISGSIVEYISVGDCRIYANGFLITEDDTVAWEKLSRKGFTSEDIACLVCRHPRRHILKSFISCSSMGNLPRPKKFSVKEDDILTFSSDGGWEVLNGFFVASEIQDLYKIIRDKSVVFYDNYTFACIKI